jgi:hypothetical protein
MQEKKLVLPPPTVTITTNVLWMLYHMQVVYNLADWIKNPMQEKKLVLPLHIAGGGLLKAVGKGITKTATGAAGAVSTRVLLGVLQGVVYIDGGIGLCCCCCCCSLCWM